MTNTGIAPSVFVREGLMGAGKTTVLHNLALRSRLDNWRMRAHFLPEPIANYTPARVHFALPWRNSTPASCLPLPFNPMFAKN